MNALLPSWLGLMELLLFGLFIVVFILFMRDFKLTSIRSWVMLLGLIGVGAVLVTQARKRWALLKEFEAREKKLKDLEERYKALKDAAEITQEAYDKAKEELDRAKVEEGLAIMKADATLEEKTREIEAGFEDATPEESVELIRRALSM